MSESKNFVDGLFIKDRNERTPDWVLASYSININKFKQWLVENEQHAVRGWLNIDIKKSQNGNKYAELNAYKPQNMPSEAPQSNLSDENSEPDTK